MRYRLAQFACTVAAMLALLVFAQKAAYAYVDPGSGLVVCQSVAAMVAGAMFYLRRRLRTLAGRVTGNEKQS